MGILFDAVRIKAGKGTLFLNGEKIAEVENVEFTMKEERSLVRTLSIRYRPGAYMREEPAYSPDRKEKSDHEGQN